MCARLVRGGFHRREPAGHSAATDFGLAHCHHLLSRAEAHPKKHVREVWRIESQDQGKIIARQLL